jgi:hypothetical protein
MRGLKVSLPTRGGVLAPAMVALGVSAVCGSAQAQTMHLDSAWDPYLAMPTPVGPWRELWPAPSTMWECIDWIDNGNGHVDYGDYLKLQDQTWWHVDMITFTVFIDETVPPRPEGPPVLDWLGPYPVDICPCFPVGTWLEVHPLYSTQFDGMDWIDNGNEIVDFCDVLVLLDTVHGGQYDMHVAETGTDLEVRRQDPPCPCDCAEPNDGLVNVTDFLAMLGEWGQDGAPCDVDGDGVGVTDFLRLLSEWGPCH